MKLAVVVDGVAGEVSLERGHDHCRFVYSIPGKPRVDGVASVIEVEPGIYSVLWEGNSYEVKIAGRSGPVEVNGRRYAVMAADPREMAAVAAGAASGREDIVAPMPGKVVRVLVEEGAEVAAGDGVVVVEAMKMQNEMPAPRAGRVSAMRVAAGATVAAGDVLATIE